MESLLSDLPLRKNPLYFCWSGMIRRCYNPKDRGFKNYGARGIKVCARWRESFWDFVSDVGERPSFEYSLDRKDNNGDYEPGNIRWATRSEQNRNTRVNRLLTAYGKTQTLEEWATETDLPKSTLLNRLKRGWPAEIAIAAPARPKAPNQTWFPVGGYQLCLRSGVNYQTVKSRLRRGWTFDAAISKPIDQRRNRYARKCVA